MRIQPTKCGKVLKNSTLISNSLGGECNWEEGATRYELKSQQFRQHLRRSFALDQSTSAFRDYRTYDQTQSLEFVTDVVEVRQAEEYLDLFRVQPNHLKSNFRISHPVLARRNISLVRTCQFHQPTCFSSQAGPCQVRTCSNASPYINGFFWKLCEDVGLKHLNSSNRISCSDDALVYIFSQTKVPGNVNTWHMSLFLIKSWGAIWA